MVRGGCAPKRSENTRVGPIFSVSRPAVSTARCIRIPVRDPPLQRLAGYHSPGGDPSDKRPAHSRKFPPVDPATTIPVRASPPSDLPTGTEGNPRDPRLSRVRGARPGGRPVSHGGAPMDSPAPHTLSPNGTSNCIDSSPWVRLYSPSSSDTVPQVADAVPQSAVHPCAFATDSMVA